MTNYTKTQVAGYKVTNYTATQVAGYKDPGEGCSDGSVFPDRRDVHCPPHLEVPGHGETEAGARPGLDFWSVGGLCRPNQRLLLLKLTKTKFFVIE